jgi:GntR family transcriptional repressor for pyruvate dehydrogenase complex
MIQPIKKKSIYKSVFDSLVKVIQNEEIAVGEKLPTEAILAEQFQVGRNSIREALKSLELMDIISSQSGVGMIISKNAIRNINLINILRSKVPKSKSFEMWETRLIIEPQMTELAIIRATDEQRKKIYDLASMSVETFNSGDYKWEKGGNFHKLISEASGNSILSNLLDIVNNIIQTRIEFIIHYKESDNELGESLLDNHLKIAECFINHDPEKGRRIMYEHLKIAFDYIKDNPDPE